MERFSAKTEHFNLSDIPNLPSLVNIENLNLSKLPRLPNLPNFDHQDFSNVEDADVSKSRDEEEEYKECNNVLILNQDAYLEPGFDYILINSVVARVIYLYQITGNCRVINLKANVIGAHKIMAHCHNSIDGQPFIMLRNDESIKLVPNGDNWISF